MTGFHRKQKEENVKIPWPLALWTVFEVGMNSWILITMFKVGVK